jgi:hypothetical protein
VEPRKEEEEEEEEEERFSHTPLSCVLRHGSSHSYFTLAQY